MYNDNHDTPPGQFLLGVATLIISIIGVTVGTLSYESHHGTFAQINLKPPVMTANVQAAESLPATPPPQPVTVNLPPAATSTPTTSAAAIDPSLIKYIVVTDSCGVHYEGTCLNARSGPGTNYPVVAKLRDNMVLKVGGEVTRGTSTWYQISFDEALRYPERLTSKWYVSGDYVKVVYDHGEEDFTNTKPASTTKRIVVNREAETLKAYDGDKLFMEVSISAGLAFTPTPRGTFTIYKKTPSRYMQGPVPGLASDQYYDLPGVPWDLYFTKQGAVIHGAYWHNDFGHPHSHGCVNLSPANAYKLYQWAPLGTPVTVY